MARKSRLMGILAIFLLVGGSPALNAAYTRQDLETIEGLILSERWQDLKAYLDRNPELLLGDDLLANELKEFNRCYDAQGIYISGSSSGDNFCGEVLISSLTDEVQDIY